MHANAATVAPTKSAADFDAARHAAREAVATQINAEFPGADALINELVGCWSSVADMIDRDGRSHYRPTCRPDIDPRMTTLAFLRISDLANATGLSARYWQQKAAAGELPGAHQPSGAGGAWRVSAAEFWNWWAATEKKPCPRTATSAAASGGRVRSSRARSTGKASGGRLRELLNM